MLGIIIGIVVIIIILIIVLKSLNKKPEITRMGNFEEKSSFQKFLDSCCTHRD